MNKIYMIYKILMVHCSAGGITGVWLPTMRLSQWRITAPVPLAPVAPLLQIRPSSPWCGAMMRQTGPGMMTSLTLWRTSMPPSWDSMNQTMPTKLASHQRRLLLLGLSCKLSILTGWQCWVLWLQFKISTVYFKLDSCESISSRWWRWRMVWEILCWVWDSGMQNWLPGHPWLSWRNWNGHEQTGGVVPQVYIICVLSESAECL